MPASGATPTPTIRVSPGPVRDPTPFRTDTPTQGDRDDGDDELADGDDDANIPPSSSLLATSNLSHPSPASGPSARPRMPCKSRKLFTEGERAQRHERRRQRELAALGFSNPGRAFAAEEDAGEQSSSTDATRRSSRRRSSVQPQTQHTPEAPVRLSTTRPSSVAEPPRSVHSSTPPLTSSRPTKRARTSASGASRRKSKDADTRNGTPSASTAVRYPLDKGKGRAENFDPEMVPYTATTVIQTQARRKSTPATIAATSRRRSGPVRRASGPSEPAHVSSSSLPPDDPLPNRRRRLLSQPLPPADLSTGRTGRPSSFIFPGTDEAQALIHWYQSRQAIEPAIDWRPMNPAHLPKEHAALMEAWSTYAQAMAMGKGGSLNLPVPLPQLQGLPPPLPRVPGKETTQARLAAFWDSFLRLEDEGPDFSPAELERLASHQGQVLAQIDLLRQQGELLADYLLRPDALILGIPSDAGSSASTPAPDGASGITSTAAPTPAPQDARTFASYLQALAPSATRGPEGKSAWEVLLDAIPGRAKAFRMANESHVRGTRKVAKMVTQHWERVAARRERERKTEERRVRSLARWTSREVAKQWRLAITVVRKRKAELARAADEQRGREQLSQILRQSTEMLEARQRGMTHGHTTEFKYGDPSHSAGDEKGEGLEDVVEEEEEEGEGEEEELSMSDAESDREQSPEKESDSAYHANGHSLLADLYADDGPSPASLAAEMTGTTKECKDEAVSRLPIVPAAKPKTALSPASAYTGRDITADVKPASDDLNGDVDEAVNGDDDVDEGENADDEDEHDDLLATADVPLEGLVKNYPGYTPASGLESCFSMDASPANDDEDLRDQEMVNSTLSFAPLAEEADSSDAGAGPHSSHTSLSLAPEAGQTTEEEEDVEADRMMVEEDERGEDDSEDAGLLADADLPLEELLRRYRNQSDDDELSELNSIRDESRDETRAPSAQKGNLTSGMLGLNPTAGDIKMWSEDESDLTSEDDGNQLRLNLPDVNGKDTNKPLVEVVSGGDQAGKVDQGHASTSSQSDAGADVEGTAPNAVGGAQPRIRSPFLLRGTLRPYQQGGLEWLADLYSNGMNGILADEMGLGKTIQTIALLAHLACDRGIWGPHLVVAPTSVMLNWEMEFKKFLPGFKILSYYGNQRERKEKRIGWQKENSFNVCITSYQLILADQHIFRRKAWMYLILDEAHHIKNFRAKRWQTLLGFHSQRRLLLTGTPLQNNLMDLWSLMYFLMPHGIDEAAGGGAFASIKDFQDWFANPLDKAIQSGDGMNAETRDMVNKLHTVLRPFILRRLKSEVERELPHKYEHVITCRLSKRQRFLYNDFMSRAATRQSLASGNYLSIINCLMQLRKVCNHPDLFEVRPIVTSFVMDRAVAADYEIKDLLVRRTLLSDQDELALSEREKALDWGVACPRDQFFVQDLAQLDASPALATSVPPIESMSISTLSIPAYRESMAKHEESMHAQRWVRHRALNRERCQARPSVYSNELIATVQSMSKEKRLFPLSVAEKQRSSFWDRCDAAFEAVQPYSERMKQGIDLVDRFAFATPAVYAPKVAELALPGLKPTEMPELAERERDILHDSAVKLQIAFPDASLLQYDCGKLQQLDLLMRRLKDGGHRILIFTQMTKVLDILESFLSFHGYRYLRLDGATKVEDRQLLTERFNRDARIMAFILSTRSGGLGINLTGADTVLFYDLDWNAAIEQQCMDRAHRIGQTRDVHIYRFVSEFTIEENMLKKANQKRVLDNVVIQQGEFSTDSLVRSDWRDMLDDGGRTLAGVTIGDETNPKKGKEIERAMLAVEDEEDRAAAQAARQEMMVDLSDWGNEASQMRPWGAAVAGATGGLEADDADDEPEEEDEGTVDDYMLRWVEADWAFFSNL